MLNISEFMCRHNVKKATTVNSGATSQHLKAIIYSKTVTWYLYWLDAYRGLNARGRPIMAFATKELSLEWCIKPTSIRVMS